MLLIYTGNGKGKTSACVGQALRALGHDMRVFFAQFLKKDVGAGEQRMLRRLLGENFFPGGAGFFRTEAERPLHRKHAEITFDRCKKALPASDMLIMDEALYALGCGLLTEDELREIIALARQHGVHLVLSGRGLPEWLLDEAELVTIMGEEKHPAQHGGKATKGIEF